MALSKLMLATIKALSYTEPDIEKHYKENRTIMNMLAPPIKSSYRMWDHQVLLDDHKIPVRVFMPGEPTTNQIIVFFHGGGWVVGNIDNYTKPCTQLANSTGRRVISVDYRLAPEFPFPCAINDCYEVAKEIILNKAIPEIESTDVVLCGDSAGGNLAAALSLMASEKGEFVIEKQILIYPSTFNDHTEETSPFDSIRENGKDYLLTSKRICEYLNHYIQNPDDFTSPYFAPLLSENLYNQPKTLIITAEFDPLRDEGEAYGKKLKRFGNEVYIYRLKNTIHGFFSLPKTFSPVKRCYKYINKFLDGDGTENIK